MSLLALTQDNIDFIKRDLKSSYPSVKSAHLSEAIAAACGFRTNISLVTRLRSAAHQLPDTTEVDAGRFSTRLFELGYPSLDGTDLPGVVRSKQMPQRIWVARKGNDLRLINDWFGECQRRDIPYVYITNRRSLAQVDWDCFTLDKKHDKVTLKDDGKLTDQLFETFKVIAKAKNGQPFFEGSSFVGNVKMVPIDWAPHLADAIFQILYQAIREGERQAQAA